MCLDVTGRTGRVLMPGPDDGGVDPFWVARAVGPWRDDDPPPAPAAASAGKGDASATLWPAPVAAMRKEGIVVGAVAVHPDGTVTIYQQGGIEVPAEAEQKQNHSEWLDVEV